MKPITSGMFGDGNCLYPTLMLGLLSVWKFYELKPEEFEKYFLENTSINGEYFSYYYIPDLAKRETNDLPMIVIQEILAAERISPFLNILLSDIDHNLKQKSLIASRDQQEKYLVSLQVVKLFLGLGLKMAKIHRIFKFM